MPANIDAAKAQAGDRAELEKIVEEMKNIWSFHTTGSPEDDWLLAEGMLSNSTA
jgi:hypothetical protein